MASGSEIPTIGYILRGNFMWILRTSWTVIGRTVEERKRKRQNESGREAYKDVRPAPLDVRQRGTPELGFSFAKDVSLFRGNLFRAYRSVRSELRGLGRTDEGPEAASGYARCQILWARCSLSLSSFVTKTAGAVFQRPFFAVTEQSFFYSYSFFLSFSLSPSPHFPRSSGVSIVMIVWWVWVRQRIWIQLILRRRAKGKILARDQTSLSPRKQEERRESQEQWISHHDFSV